MPESLRSQEAFEFISPVRLVFRRDVIDRLDEILYPPGEAPGRTLVVIGRGSARRSGLLDRLLAGLSGEAEVFEGVEPNPSVSTVEAGARRAREVSAGRVIGLGGGSAMDAAKVIAALAANDGGFAALLGRDRLPQDPLETICVPTTCGTGSEANAYAIITDPDAPGGPDKVNFSCRQSFPAAGVLDPACLDALPREILVATALDAFSHAFEGFTSRRSSPAARMLAAEAMGLIFRHLPPAAEGGEDDRANLLWASALAGVVIHHTGTTVLHALGYYLTLRHGIPHGRANAILLPVLMDHLSQVIPSQIGQVLSLMPDGERGLEAMEAFLRGVGVETALSTHGIRREEIEDWIEYTLAKRNTRLTAGELDRGRLRKLLMGHL
jgi:alcohol dehydrogenase class IV